MIKMCANCANWCTRNIGSNKDPCINCDDASEWQPKFTVEDELISKAEVYNKIIPLIKNYCSDQVVNDITDLIDNIKGYKRFSYSES